MLEWQHVPIQLTGLDTKSDDKNSIPGTFVTAENVYMLKTGKLQNRHGYKFPANPITHTSEVVATIASDNGNIAIERSGKYYFDEVNGNNIVNTSHALTTIGFDTALFSTSIQNKTINTYTFSTSENYTTFCYTTGTTSFSIDWFYISRTSNTILSDSSSGNISLGTVAVAPPVSVGGDTFFYVRDSDTIVRWYQAGVGSANTWSTGLSGTIQKLECDTSTNYHAVLVQDSSNNIKLGVYNKNAGTWGSVSVVATTAAVNIAVYLDEANSKIYTVYQNNSDKDFYVRIYNLSAVLGDTYTVAFTDNSTKLTIAAYSATQSLLMYQFTSIYGKTISCQLITNSTGVAASNFTIYDTELVSKITYPYFIVKNSDGTANAAYFIYEMDASNANTFNETNRAVCSYGYGETIPQQNAAIFTASNSLIEFNNLVFPFIKFNPLNSTETIYSIIIGTMKGNVTTNLPQVVEWNGSTITNAWGSLRTIDTKIYAYALWTSWPIAAPAATLAATTSGGPTALGTGTYYYTIVYTAYDIDNNAIYSTPLRLAAITFGGGTTNGTNVTAVTQSIFFQFPRYQLSLYRTEVNGDVFYFVANVQNAVTYTDVIPDTTLIQNRALYTTGGIIESGPAPIAKFLALIKNRLWMITSESNDLIYYSKKQFPNEAPQFNSVYTVKVQRLGGDLEAIAEMDDKVVIFRRNAVFVCYGDGIDELGNGTFSDPQLITQSLGCKQGRSIVLNDKGIMFMSYEGIYMITRGLTVEYIGAPVEKYNSLTITQAINLVDRHEVWFYSAEGTTLVHNDLYGTWHVFTNQPTYAANMLNNGTPYYYRTLAASKYPGRMLIEDSSYYYDGAVDNPIAINIETGWLSLGGIQGFQRMRTLTWIGDLNNTATISVYQDFEAAASETFTVLPATVGTSPAQYQIKPKRQKLQSLKYKITLSSLSGDFTISSLGIEAAIKAGTFKFDRTKRVQGV